MSNQECAQQKTADTSATDDSGNIISTSGAGRGPLDAMVSLECRDTQAPLNRAIEDALSDARRSGCFGKLLAAKITALAHQSLEQSVRTVYHWTQVWMKR